MAIARVDGVLRRCVEDVTRRGWSMQCCDGHFRAPTLMEEHEEQADEPVYTRYCEACRQRRPLHLFRGFSPFCSAHRDKQSSRGKVPAIPDVVVGTDLVVRSRGVCATLVCGATPRSDRKGLAQCDVIDCDGDTFQACGLCSRHSCVRRPLSGYSLLVCHAVVWAHQSPWF